MHHWLLNSPIVRLFVIIALGESVLITGATFAKLEWTAESSVAFVVSLTGSIAMWWVYFHVGAKQGTRVIEHTENPGRFARLAYTYIHAVIIGGVMLCAAADEILLETPDARPGVFEALLLAGGPAVFLAGCLLFKWATTGRPPLSHQIGIGLLIAVLASASLLPALAVSGLAVAALITVAALESRWITRPGPKA